ncbi:DNA-binding transcriptional regulator, XRE-family HTH domain [Virgibacillus subterraneus]|uniref:DNA-binding transcriptional regulator, XRE-family HTH domain n=1 Tax=Virgibacillus subterraneus TaxID=621109 RepID=A0A1H9E9Q0_9BACI|nr:helix-turn-helix transcriptional regulator [Virgibacillus subterraneus]SEQ22446.1 DNA-binding transcriptional regulator, XRE-family HTH domain [Virgibacillus subterraneus]
MELTLKQARQFSDLSQAEIAGMLGVHRQTYMKWERNPDEMPLGKAKEFSIFTKTPLDNIFFIPSSTFSRVKEGEIR